MLLPIWVSEIFILPKLSIYSSSICWPFLQASSQSLMHIIGFKCFYLRRPTSYQVLAHPSSYLGPGRPTLVQAQPILSSYMGSVVSTHGP